MMRAYLPNGERVTVVAEDVSGLWPVVVDRTGARRVVPAWALTERPVWRIEGRAGWLVRYTAGEAPVWTGTPGAAWALPRHFAERLLEQLRAAGEPELRLVAWDPA